MEFNTKTIKQIMFLIIFAGIVLAIALNPGEVAGFFNYIMTLCKPVFIGLTMAFVLNIFMELFEEKLFLKIVNRKSSLDRFLKRPLAIICSLAITVFLAGIFCLIVLPEVGSIFTTLAEALPMWISQSVTWAGELLAKYDIDITQLPLGDINWESAVNNVLSTLKSGSEALILTAIGTIGNIAGMVTNFVLGLVIAIYVLAQKEKVCSFARRLCCSVFPYKVSSEILRITRMSSTIFSQYIFGQCLEAIILSALCFIGMIIFRFPFALPISVMVMFLALIPIVGALLSAVIGGLLILTVSPLKGILFVLFLTILQQFEDNLIYPKIVGKAVGLPSLLVLLAIMIGGNMFGVVGIVFGVPVIGVLYTLLGEYMYQKCPPEDDIK